MFRGISSTATVRRTFPSPRSQSGQIGVIVLLMMVVLLTVGLSLAARTTQELFLSQQTAESSRVFNAAEAGIEAALATQMDVGGQDVVTGSLGTVNGVDVNYQVTKFHALETKVFQGVTVMTNLDPAAFADGQRVNLEWSRSDDCAAPGIASLLVSIYSEEGGVTRVRHEALAGCNRGDGFTMGTSINNNGYRRQAYITLRNAAERDLFIRIKPLYNDTDLRVTGDGWQLPVQYFNIRSEASNQQGDGTRETRIVEVNRTLPTAPSVMDFAVYSGTTLVK